MNWVELYSWTYKPHLCHKQKTFMKFIKKKQIQQVSSIISIILILLFIINKNQLNLKTMYICTPPPPSLPIPWNWQKISLEFSASFEIPEAELVKDLVYVFQGIEGKWIKFDASKDAYKVDAQVCWSLNARKIVG